MICLSLQLVPTVVSRRPCANHEFIERMSQDACQVDVPNPLAGGALIRDIRMQVRHDTQVLWYWGLRSFYDPSY